MAPAPFGGLETVLRTLAVGHAMLGHTVRVAAVLTPDQATHPFVDALARDGIPTDTIRVGARSYLSERSAIRGICQRHRPDVVHTHGYRPDVVDGGVARGQKIGAVSTCHGFIESGWRARAYHWVQRRALRAFDAVIAVSSPIEKMLRNAGIPSAKISLVPNAYLPSVDALSRDESRRALAVPAGTMVGWVGRLSAEKGLDVALRALSRVDRPDVYLIVIGEGREESALRELARSLGVADRVLWRGAVPNAQRLFAAFDVFLLSSWTEGTPMVLLEAMAANVPVIATEVGGVPDVVDSSCGHLVAAGDAPAIARALYETLTDSDRTENRIRRAKERLLENFDTSAWLARYESIYRSVVRR